MHIATYFIIYSDSEGPKSELIKTITRGVCVLVGVCVCVWGGGGGGSVEPPFDSEFHFHGNFCKLVNLRYRIYPKYSHLFLFTLYFFSTSPVLLPVNVCKIAG